LVHSIVSAPLQLEPIHLAAVTCTFGDGLRFSDAVHEFELKVHQVDGHLLLASKVLLDAREEGLREEESAHPETQGRPLLLPLQQELHPLVQVQDPGRERFERELATALLLRPACRHFVVGHLQAHLLELFVHDDPAPVGLNESHEVLVHGVDEGVLAHSFLHEYRVHGVFVLGGLLQLEDLQVESCGHLGLELLGLLLVEVFDRLALLGGRGLGLDIGDGLQHVFGNHLVCVDFGVDVEAE